MFQVSIWFPFLFVWRTFISNFLWENLLTMNSLSILYTKNILKSFRSKMMYLLDIEFLFWHFFFSPFNDQLISGFLMRNPQSFKVFFKKYTFIYFNWRLLYNILLVLPYIIMNPPEVYTCSPSWTPLPPPSPYHPSGSSQCTSPKHPVSCIELGLVICFIYDIIHVSMPFSQIIPPSPSPTESKRLFYTSVSLLQILIPL